MPENKDSQQSRLKWLSDELGAKSKSLIVTDDVPHFFWILDTTTGECGYFGNIASSEACRIVEILARQHGTNILDRVFDKLIEEGENLEFPTLVECTPSRINKEESPVVKETKKKVS